MTIPTIRSVLGVAGALALVFASCSGDNAPADVESDEAYVRMWCKALVVYRDEILDPARRDTPYAERNIEANEHFVDTMSGARPPDDAKNWHRDWIAAIRENIRKLKAKDPAAQPDPMDVGPDYPLPTRIEALFGELPECFQLRPTPEPTRTPGTGTATNAHTNAVARLVGPGQLRVSFDYTYAADPPGMRITALTVSVLGAGGLALPDYTTVLPISRGAAHRDVDLTLAEGHMEQVTRVAICFTGPGEPDLGCVRVPVER